MCASTKGRDMGVLRADGVLKPVLCRLARELDATGLLGGCWCIWDAALNRAQPFGYVIRASVSVILAISWHLHCELIKY